MRILVVCDGIPPAVLGGAGGIAWQTAAGLRARGHEVTILTATPGVPGTRTIPQLPTRWAHWRSIFSKKRAAEVLSVIEDVKPDLIHAHVVAWQAGYRWIPEARRHGLPVVFTAHDVMQIAFGRIRPGETGVAWKDARRLRWSWNPWRNSRIRAILNSSATVLCVSDALRETMQAYGFMNLRTLHNGIDLDFWKPGDRAAARRELDLPQDGAVFFFAGRLGYDKGLPWVDAAFPEDALLCIAGDDVTSLFQRIPASRIRFFPRQSPERMRLLYAASDATLAPSLCLDCFPTACLESMACARPVLASAWGGAKESVRDGVTGWICDPEQPDTLAERLRWCTDHRDALPEIGAAGRRRMEEEFSLERYVDDLEKIYREKIPNPKSQLH